MNLRLLFPLREALSSTLIIFQLRDNLLDVIFQLENNPWNVIAQRFSFTSLVIDNKSIA